MRLSTFKEAAGETSPNSKRGNREEKDETPAIVKHLRKIKERQNATIAAKSIEWGFDFRLGAPLGQVDEKSSSQAQNVEPSRARQTFASDRFEASDTCGQL